MRRRPLLRPPAVRLIAQCLTGLLSLPMALTPLPAQGQAAASSPASVVPPDKERGRQHLARYQCGQCHAIPGVPSARGTLAASLAQYGRRSYIAGRVPNTPERLAAWVMAPASIVPDTAMPSMGVTPADARDIAAYLGSLR